MPDLSALLHAAAPEPTRPLDMAAIHRRARLRGWRRVIAAVAGTGALLVAGIGVSDSLVVHADNRGRSGGRDAQRPVTVDNHSNGALPAARVDARSATNKADASTGRPRELRSPPSTTTTTVVDAFPAREACSVDTAALGVSESRRCTFTATATGGVSMKSEAPASSYDTQPARGEVFVTRQGKRVSVWNSDDCGSRTSAGELAVFYGQCIGEFVHPGDRVEVVITKTRDDPFAVTLGAGKGW
jgi:hypothetical protein